MPFRYETILSHRISSRYLAVLATLCVLFGIFCSRPATASSVAQRGWLDLSQSDFEQGAPLSLEGEWEFYWQQLLDPSAFVGLPTESIVFYPIPAIWEDGRIADTILTSLGKATYRLRVKLPPDHRQIGLRLPYFYGWARVFLDGQLVAELGKFDRVALQTDGAGGGSYIFHTALRSELEIVIQIANYNSIRGGISGQMLLSRSEAMARYKALRFGFDLFIISALLFMAFYHICMFHFRRQDTSNLWFGVFSLFIAMRSAIVGEGYVVGAIFELSALWAWRLELVTYYLAMAVISQFITTIYPNETDRRIPVFSAYLAVSLSVLTLVTQSAVFNYTRPIMQCLNLVLVLAYGVAISRAIIHRREGARLFMAGFFAMATLSMVEIYTLNTGMNLPRLSPVGMYLFVGFQSILLAKRFNTAYDRIETSERDIRRLNLELQEQEKTKLALAKISAERHMLQTSMAEAHEVYTSLGMEQGGVRGVQFVSYYQPAEIAGGDWFAVNFDQTRQRFYLVVGDVTGHDLMSALVTIASAGVFRGGMEVVKQLDRPKSMLENLELIAGLINDAVRESGKNDQRLMTVSLIAIDIATGDMAYVNAGHAPLLKVSGSHIKAVLVPASPLGLHTQPRFGKLQIKLSPGDGVFIYTDGLMENRGRNRKQFSMRSLKKILTEEADPQRAREKISQALRDLWADTDRKDDCSFVYVKWLGLNETAGASREHTADASHSSLVSAKMG